MEEIIAPCGYRCDLCPVYYKNIVLLDCVCLTKELTIVPNVPIYRKLRKANILLRFPDLSGTGQAASKI